MITPSPLSSLAHCQTQIYTRKCSDDYVAEPHTYSARAPELMGVFLSLSFSFLVRACHDVWSFDVREKMYFQAGLNQAHAVSVSYTAQGYFID